MTHHIEDREIRGISAKTLRGVIVQTIIICMGLAGSYYGIQHRFDEFDKHSEIQDLQIETLRTQLKKMQTEIDINGVHIQSLILDNERVKAKLGINN